VYIPRDIDADSGADSPLVADALMSHVRPWPGVRLSVASQCQCSVETAEWNKLILGSSYTVL